VELAVTEKAKSTWKRSKPINIGSILNGQLLGWVV